MKILKQSDVELIESLSKSEADLINRAFSLSKELGLLHLSNAITSFKEYIDSVYGEVIVSYCSEYRVFLVALMKEVDEEYQEDVLREVLIPSINDVGDEDVMRIYASASMKWIKSDECQEGTP